MHLFQKLSQTFRLVGGACVLALLAVGCAGHTMQYPPFPDQSRRIEDPAQARVYLIRPPGGMNASQRFIFYGAGPAACGPKVDPRQWLEPVPLFGIYPENPTPDSPLRMVGEVASGAYLCWEEPPRVLTFRNIDPIPLTAGNSYYLRVTIPAFSEAIIQAVDEEEGQALLKKCRPPDGYQKEIPK